MPPGPKASSRGGKSAVKHPGSNSAQVQRYRGATGHQGVAAQNQSCTPRSAEGASQAARGRQAALCDLGQHGCAATKERRSKHTKRQEGATRAPRRG
eukprot:962203-Alexandrium_andersonii.AAC.1